MNPVTEELYARMREDYREHEESLAFWVTEGERMARQHGEGIRDYRFIQDFLTCSKAEFACRRQYLNDEETALEKRAGELIRLITEGKMQER